MAQRQAIYNLKVDTKGADKSVDSLKKEFLSLDSAMEQTSKRGNSTEKSLKDLNNTVDNVGFAFEDTTRVIDAYKNIASEAGMTSAIGKEAIQRAAQLEREYQDLEQTIGHMAERGNAFQSAIGISETVLGGYAAFQGVTAMLGVENEELLETITKMQAAQSVLMGIESIRANLQKNSATMTGLIAARTKIATAATWAYGGAQKAMNLALGAGTKASKIFRGALLATGVGAIVVGIGLLVQHFDTLVGWVSDAAEWFVSLGDKFEWLGAIIDFISAQFDQFIAILRYIGVLESEEAAARRRYHEERVKQLDEQIEKHGKLREELTSKYDHAIALAKAENKDTHALEMSRLDSIRQNIKEEMKMRFNAMKSRQELGEEITDEELDKLEEMRISLRDINNEIELAEVQHQQKLKQEEQKGLDERQKAWEKAQEEKRKKQEEEAKLQLELEKTIQDLMIENIEDANLRKLAKLETQHRREREQLIEKYGKDTELLKELELNQSNQLSELRNQIESREKEKDLAKQQAQREEELMRLESDLMVMELDFQTKLEKERELELARRDMLLKNDELTEQERRRIRIESNQKIAEINQQEVERQEATDAAIKASKESLVSAFSGVYSALKGLVDENSKLGKAMALTEIAVNTAIGFSKGLVIAQNSAAGTGPGAAVAFPIFYAQQIAAVIGAASQAKKILSTAPGISSGGGGGISAPSSGGGGGGASSPPDINDRDNNEGNLTSDDDFTDNAPQKVFVTETDISRTQKRARDIEVRSTY